MAGSAPYYSNIRWGGPQGGRIPTEQFPGTFLLQPDAGNTTSQIIIGAFNATTAGSGIPVSPSRTFIERGNADDGGKVLTGSGAAYLFGSRRLLLTKAQTGNNSFFGGCDRLSIAADESALSAEIAGHWGMLECKSGGVIGSTAGNGAVRGDIKIDSGGDIATGTIASCFLAACEGVGSSHTGRAVVLDVRKPQTGTFDALMEIKSTSGAVTAKTTPGTYHYGIPVAVDGGTVYYIPVCEMS